METLGDRKAHADSVLGSTDEYWGKSYMIRHYPGRDAYYISKIENDPDTGDQLLIPTVGPIRERTVAINTFFDSMFEGPE